MYQVEKETTSISEDTSKEDTISLADMDSAIKAMKDKREEYTTAKKSSDLLHEEVKILEAKVISMLEKAGKTVYIAEGIGRVRVSYEMSVQTPKTPEDKKAFFQWLIDNMGQEVADAYLTVNSQSLNSLYNDLTEEYARRGEVLMVDGLGEPISRTKLSLTKA